MKNPTSRPTPRGGFSVLDSGTVNKRTVPSRTAPAQVASVLSATSSSFTTGIDCGCIWRGPRDRSRAIQATIREYHGHHFLDLRGLQMNEAGRMVPNGQRLTVSAKQIGKFSALVGAAFRKAERLGLTPGTSS